MSDSSSTFSRGILILVMFVFVVGIVVYGLFENGIENLSVTWINWIFGVITLIIAGPLMIAGVMGNDSGKGGFTTKLTQFLFMSYPLFYLVGLIGSIELV